MFAIHWMGKRYDMHDKRPSDRELIKRLNEAKEFLKNRHGVFANPSKAVGELKEKIK